MLFPYLEALQKQLSGGSIELVSVGMFFPYVMNITLGKTLSKKQMRLAFAVMQDGFAPMEGRITRC